MERHGDLITNGLDLISFLLVTPEIVRVIAPPIDFFGKAVALVLGLFVAMACLAALFLALSSQWNIFTWLRLPDWVILVVLVAVLIPLEVTLPLIRWIYRRGSKHLFAVGIVLFIASRLIACYGSALRAGLL